ncbi:nuclear transport factor 2 family protein [Actinospica sp.]|uniref:nuclear transport factor 2 family protein n=1 Tax=Actinospica sp. TaxID=1872142 RepID=UPI002CC0557F|nr:nuclear transport factor 2 family protein [Actinospica sp.]HWG23304.1 nuclear transport factor 2 family protein [Actinospica sp.]
MIFSLEDRVRRVADELAIRNVIALLARYADEGTLEDYGALFALDACWELPGARIRKGRADIVAGGAERRAAGVAGPDTHTRHLVSTVSVALDGDRAQAESYWQFYATTDSVPCLQSMGYYRDLFRLTAKGWRLHYRQVTLG